MNEAFSELTVIQLRKILEYRGLSVSYKVKAELVFRLKASVQEGETIESILQILVISNNDEEEKFEDSLSGDENMTTHFTFRDVEDALEKFSGESETNIETWLANFEDVATTCKWNDIQKYLFARKLLIGAARKAIEGDRTIINYELLIAKLKKEFKEDLTIGEIHDKLVKRKKNTSESYLEYYYEMQRIAMDKMDAKSIIQYIVNGIPYSTLGKAILYDSTTLEVLKSKLKTYEGMRSQRDVRDTSVKPKTFDRKSKEESSSDTTSTNKYLKRCYNCGSRSHQGNLCPDKGKGTRCFNCNKFGHIGKECKEKKSAADTDQVKPVRTISVIPKETDAHTYAQCGLDLIYSLVDSGSWVTHMRETVFGKLRHKPSLKVSKEPFRGLGNVITRAVGSFDCLVTIDDDTYDVECWIVKDDHITEDMIIGLDIINQAALTMVRGKVTMKKLIDGCDENDETFINRIKEINFIDKINAPKADLSHIEDVKIREELQDMIENYSPKIPEKSCVELKVCLMDEVPIYEKPRSLAPKEKEIVNETIQHWIEKGICRPSKSAFASAVVLRPKKTPVLWRLCIDFRRLNRKVIRDRFLMPIMDDVIDVLQEATVYSTLDLVDGFFHVDVDEDSIKYLSFIVPDGQYECLKAPFGFANSPAVFQRFINTIFKTLMYQKIVAVYLDDVSVPGKNDDDGMEKLKRVLAKAEENGLIINWRKSTFLAKRIKFLGFILENGTIKPSNEKTEAVRKFPAPSNVQQIQSFLGLTGFLRRFVPNYATIAKPLSDLTKKDVKFEFGYEQQEAFVSLKAVLCDNPVLKMYNPDAEKTELHTDASKWGFGAMLMQRDSEDQKMHPVYYLSYKTTPAQQKYDSYDLETLAIYKSVKKLRVYLLGLKFEIFTDCQAFERSMLKKELIPRIAKWALYINQFDCKLVHQPGTKMKHVDALSRMPRIMFIEDGLVTKIRQMQRADDKCKTILKVLESKSYEDFVNRKGILYKWTGGDTVLVVPNKMQRELIRSIHEKGHLSARKVETLMKRDYYIDKLGLKVSDVIANCIACILANRKEGKKDGLLNPIEKGDVPLHTYHVDHIGPLQTTAKSYNHLLVVIDAFSKFTWLYPVKAKDVAEVIKRLEFQREVFGNPFNIVADKGGAYISNEFEAYCNDNNINRHLITTGVPRGNGQVERINRIIYPVLTKLSSENPGQWYRHTSRLQTILNSTTTRSTGKTPFEILVGVKMRVKDDYELAKQLEEALREDFLEQRQEMRKLAKQNIAKLQEENRKTFNRNIRSVIW